MNGILTKTVAFLALGGFAILPMTADAQSHRQKTKNDWRNAAYASGAVGALGFLTNHQTIGWLGLGGAGYSAWRYEQDRKSQSNAAHRYSLRRRHRTRSH
jgi:hypothetical protein